LIPESDSSQSSDSERPKPPKITVLSYILGEAMHETSPRYFLPLAPFTVNIGLNTDVQNTDVLFVKSCITEEFLWYCNVDDKALLGNDPASEAQRPFLSNVSVNTFQQWSIRCFLCGWCGGYITVTTEPCVEAGSNTSTVTLQVV
jgi:hypothetical protein